MRKDDRQLNECNNNQREQNIETTINQRYSSRESENINILLQERLSEKRQDKTDDEQ